MVGLQIKSTAVYFVEPTVAAAFYVTIMGDVQWVSIKLCYTSVFRKNNSIVRS